MQRSRRRFLTHLAATLSPLGAPAFWLAASNRARAESAGTPAARRSRTVLPAPCRPSPADWSDNRLTLAWLGHSTVLINFYGIRVLTDPALGRHVGISFGLGTIGPRRLVAPALSAAELPPIDVLLLSHAHMDHLDLPTLRRLAPGAFTVTAESTADILPSGSRKRLAELGWNDKTSYRNRCGELQIEAVEVKHWGQRWPSKRPRGYNGYILRREGKAVLFGGDTALTPALGQVRGRGPFEVGIMPIGAYRPWIWNHCTPEQALEMANAARARYVVPVHHQTFRLSDEPINEPIERLTAALQSEPERLALNQVGQTFECPQS